MKTRKVSARSAMAKPGQRPAAAEPPRRRAAARAPLNGAVVGLNPYQHLATSRG